ncbi:PRC-barrel domain-containing protein [Pedobacter sp. V48]|uniref:PRC-barrel domain-containing protein n=1 Tax=Pedobacter sp. V48 TaxID=509635 RepID=UPI0003E4B488|nr:PRC-barrel domain-containing protein [Pedobacter sp. V48]ETZ19562.1 hypothetical protein N824_12535 [Pedobacter sp. V48]
MQIHSDQLYGVTLTATDGKIGTVKDLYFDDENWILRYLVVETDSWLFKRKVLISPCALVFNEKLNLDALPVSLSKEQIKNSPHIDTDMPVSRQEESSLFNHYSWPVNGRAGLGYPTTAMLKEVSAQQSRLEHQDKFDPNLRSLQHISQYSVHNPEGIIGRAKDLVIELPDWTIPYLLIDDIFTSDEERVLVSTDQIVSIDWNTRQISVSMSRDELQKAYRINPPGFFSNR